VDVERREERERPVADLLELAEAGQVERRPFRWTFPGYPGQSGLAA